MKYEEFIKQREQYGNDDGFEPLYMPDCLFDFQKHLTQWALRKGRAALFEDCGLGKTIQALVWSIAGFVFVIGFFDHYICYKNKNN